MSVATTTSGGERRRHASTSKRGRVRSSPRRSALEALLDYRDRYAAVLSMPFKPGKLEVVGTVPGTAPTDFGATTVFVN